MGESSSRHGPNRLRLRLRRGQSAIQEVGLSAALLATLITGFVAISTTATRDQAAITAADQQKQIAQVAASYVQANYAAFMGAFIGGAACGGVVNGMVASYPLTGTLPNIQGPAGTTCKTLNSMGLTPTAAATTNPYQQTYTLVTTQTAPAGGVAQLQVFLATVGGQALVDGVASTVARRIGKGGGFLPTPAMQASLGANIRSTSGNYAISPALLNGAITPGHPVVYLNYLLAGNTNGDLQRYSSSIDATPNRMEATLYMAGRDSSTGAPVNLALNGAAIGSGTPAAAVAATGAGIQPSNSVLGARQLDGQVITPGNSVGLPYVTNAAQAAAELAAGQTVNDSVLYPGVTVLADANLNVTSGHRFSAAGGLFIPGTTASQTADDAASAGGRVGSINNGTGSENAQGLRAITFDASGGSGLQLYWNKGLGKYFLATYAGPAVANGGVIGTVGFEADGGIRTNVVYDSQNGGTYYVTPAGDSNLAGNIASGKSISAALNITAGATVQGQDVVALNNVLANCNVEASPYGTYTTAAMPPTPPEFAGLPAVTVTPGTLTPTSPAIATPCGNVKGWNFEAGSTISATETLQAGRGITTDYGNIRSNHGFLVATGDYYGNDCATVGSIAIDIGSSAFLICKADRNGKIAFGPVTETQTYGRSHCNQYIDGHKTLLIRNDNPYPYTSQWFANIWGVPGPASALPTGVELRARWGPGPVTDFDVIGTTLYQSNGNGGSSGWMASTPVPYGYSIDMVTFGTQTVCYQLWQ